jgi:hypothetical protein
VKIAAMRNGHFDFTDAEFVSEEFFEANRRRAGVQSKDILVSSTGIGSLGKVDIWNSEEPALATVDVNIIRADPDLCDPDVLAFVLRSHPVQSQIQRELTGSTNQIHIYGDQLASLRIPVIERGKSTSLVEAIRRTDAELSRARRAIRREGDVIDDVISAEFGYPLREHRERSRVRDFTETLSGVGRGYMLRSSAKFHHPDFELTEQFFSRTPHARVKALVAVPIRLGATASKGDFVEDGAAYYVHPGATKRESVIALEDCYQVIEEFYESGRRRFNLRMNDIVLNRAGEGTIGKSALWTSEVPALFSDFTMRLRLTEHVNPRFVWYFLRSVMFQAQIEREKRGMGNMTNIFPPEVERMLIVACDPARQNSIARAIDEELARLDALRAGIEAKRQEIDRLIDDAVRGAGAHS